MIAADALNVVVVAIALGLLVFVIVRWWSYWDAPSATRGFTSKRGQMERPSRSGIEQNRQEGTDAGMTDETLFCPFTRQPCMGRDCACAVHAYSWGGTKWYCGIVDKSSAVPSPIYEEPVGEEPNDYRRD